MYKHSLNSIRAATFLATQLIALTAMAHPGHETLPIPSESPAHYLFEPLHGGFYWIVAGGLSVIGYLIAQRIIRQRSE